MTNDDDSANAPAHSDWGPGVRVSDIADGPLLVEHVAPGKSVGRQADELFALTATRASYRALLEKAALQGERQGAGFFVRGRSLARQDRPLRPIDWASPLRTVRGHD